jgi:hypothetical protein
MPNLSIQFLNSRWVSPLIVVPKNNGKWRICVDYREFEQSHHEGLFPSSFHRPSSRHPSGKKYFSFLDGFSGYNQIQIAPEDQDKTTFTCPWGKFTYRVLPFRLCNAPATFQRVVLGIFSNLIHDYIEVYMDEFTVYNDSFEGELENLRKVLIICQATNLSLSHEKCHMLLTKGVVLGHIISSTGIEVDPTKIEVLSKLPVPNTLKEVRSFLGYVGYYRIFIDNFTNIVAPLFKLLSKDVEFSWNDQCQHAFETLKENIFVAPILRGPNWSLPFHISMDASDTTLGDVLGKKENQSYYAIYFVSKNLTPTELNYTITKKEFLAVVHAINKFRHYITGYEVFIHTDHSSIHLLNEQNNH